MPRLTLAAIAAAVALVPLTVAGVIAIRNAVDSVLFASVWDDRVVVALDIENGRELGRFRVGRAPVGLGWGPSPAR